MSEPFVTIPRPNAACAGCRFYEADRCLAPYWACLPVRCALGYPVPSGRDLASRAEEIRRMTEDVPDGSEAQWAAGYCRILARDIGGIFDRSLEALRQGWDLTEYRDSLNDWLGDWGPRIARYQRIMLDGHRDAVSRANAARPRRSNKIRDLDTPEKALVGAVLAGVNALKGLLDRPPRSLGEEVDLAKRYPALLTPSVSRRAERLHAGAVEAERAYGFTGPRGDVFRLAGLTEEETVAFILCDWEHLSYRRAGLLCHHSKNTVMRWLADAHRKYAASRNDPAVRDYWADWDAEVLLQSSIFAIDLFDRTQTGGLSLPDDMRGNTFIEDLAKKVESDVGDHQRQDGRDGASAWDTDLEGNFGDPGE